MRLQNANGNLSFNSLFSTFEPSFVFYLKFSRYLVVICVFAMSIEQTSQLISLILNSVLMTLLSAVLLGGAWLRQNGLHWQLKQVQHQYRRLTHQGESGDVGEIASEPEKLHRRNQLKASLKQVREQRQRLTNQYHWSYVGMLLFHGVLLVFGASLLALALRSLIFFDSLISTALVLFTLGVIGLIAGTSCILLDISQGNSGSDGLSYSLAKILSQLAQQWQRRQGQFVSKQLASRSVTGDEL